MASGNDNDSKEKVDLINFKEYDQEDFAERMSRFSGVNMDWKRYATDDHAKSVAIREQLGTSYNFEMRSEVQRLKSFHTYDKVASCSPAELASAGFYGTGVGQSIQCFCCGIVICGRSLRKLPEQQHVTFNPTCRFMKGEDVGNISKYEVRVQSTAPEEAPSAMFTTEEARLKSFTDWPFYSRIQPKQLASAGFFYTGRRDTVRCFSCGGCLGNWQEKDDSWKEHAKWFPQCDFLRNQKTPEEITEYVNSYNGFKGLTGKDFITTYDDRILPNEQCAASLNIFEDERVRLESFKTWPSDANVQPPALIKAGFFYTGEKDLVRCYICGVSICSFEPEEDPMMGHLKHSKDCIFLKRVLETNGKDSGTVKSQQVQMLDQFVDIVEEREVQRTENCLNVSDVQWSHKAWELRRCLMNVYNNSIFSKLSPFPGSSNISIDLKSLFADISTVLKDIRNQPIRQLTLPDILSELRDITMIEGEAGSGKTALLKKIAILWASGKCPLLSRFSLVFYISLSTTDRQQSLYDIICQQLVGSKTSINEKSMEEIIKQLKEKVLFLLDDCSMMDSPPGATEELLLKNSWNRVTIAVTVPTDRSSKVRLHAKNIVSIQDFPPSSTLYILKQLFSHDIPFLESFYVNLAESGALQAALKTPLFAFALCVCWVQMPVDYKSKDFSICKTCLMYKMLKHSTEKEKLEAMVLSCGQLALEGVFKPRFEFTQENLDEAGVNRSDTLRFGLFSMFTSQRLHPIFRFFHPSFQEYVASIKMNELLQSEDDTQYRKGLSYLQEINTFLKVIGRYFYFLKNCCMHSAKTTTVIISHLFSLMDNREAFSWQEDSNLHLKHYPELEIREQLLSVMTLNMDFLHPFIINMLLEFAIKVAYQSKCMARCAPIILQFLKGKDIVHWGVSEFFLLVFLREYPEGLTLLKSLKANLVSTLGGLGGLVNEFWNTDSYKSMWKVPKVEEDYSKAFRLTSDTLQKKPDFDYQQSLKTCNLSNLGFDVNLHRISVLKIEALGTAKMDENTTFLCSLANHIELNLNNCSGFMDNIWPGIDNYKMSIVKLDMASSEFSREEQGLITQLTSLENLHISNMPPPEYILSEIHHFKELKELVLECPPGDWDIIGILPDEFKNLHKMESLVFKYVDMATHSDKLAKMIECFPNLKSFKLQCKYCPDFEKIITSLCHKEKMEKIIFHKEMNNNEIIHLALALPSLKSLKTLETEFSPFVEVEAAETFAGTLGFLDQLEEFTFPGGPAVKETAAQFIQQLQFMPNLRKLSISLEQLKDSSLLALANLSITGHLSNLQELDLNNNHDITQSGWRDFFHILDNLPKLSHLSISRVIAHQFKADPVTLIALLRCVLRLRSLRSLCMFGWLLDDKDLELVNDMKSKHPQAKSLLILWQNILPFPPVIME
ncbi:baculoviral IAP repeat-containing protein 1e-like isoform X2 [Hyperolius riggenbachi]|uniref:baculoviral IAP repeat-containing protein 1e-like isoform X2 n=1 Tax=Hyperolius riggenbachi TaxID=752182 RepID=UPI0035A351BF